MNLGFKECKEEHEGESLEYVLQTCQTCCYNWDLARAWAPTAEVNALMKALWETFLAPPSYAAFNLQIPCDKEKLLALEARFPNLGVSDFKAAEKLTASFKGEPWKETTDEDIKGSPPAQSLLP